MMELQYGNHAFSEIQQQSIRESLNKIFSVEKNNVEIDFLKEHCGVGNSNINSKILTEDQDQTNQTNSYEIAECCKFKKILRKNIY